MLTLEQAQTAILAGIHPCEETETADLAAAHRRFLAAPVVAVVDNPAFDNSAMDGYALRVADLAANDSSLPLAGESSCGSAPAALAPGSAMRIFTGAPLPAGADTVVMQEEARMENGRVRFPSGVRAEQNVRRRGEDFRAGDALIAPGRRLTAYDLALSATAGIARATVYRRSRVLVAATGDELVAPGEALAPGQIYESNRLALLVQLRALGMEAIDGGTVRDDAAALRQLLKNAGEYDFLITSGGVSVGDHDLVKQVFGETGRIEFWKAAIKPGKPIAFGRLGQRTHFFGLPGNPVSSLVTYKLLVEPALYAWHRARWELIELNAVATAGFRRRPGRTEFLRARIEARNGELHATPLKGQGSHMLRPLADTNGFIRIEADAGGFDAGEAVRVVPLFFDRF